MKKEMKTESVIEYMVKQYTKTRAARNNASRMNDRYAVEREQKELQYWSEQLELEMQATNTPAEEVRGMMDNVRIYKVVATHTSGSEMTLFRTHEEMESTLQLLPQYGYEHYEYKVVA